MAGRKKQSARIYDPKEGIATSYCAALCTDVGLIWRELTGRDVGLDGAVECVRDERNPESMTGLAFVQIKCGRGFDKDEFFSFPAKARHDQYWLDQQAPLLVCLVQLRPGSQQPSLREVERAIWIDYKALPPEAKKLPTSDKGRYRIDKSKCNLNGRPLSYATGGIESLQSKNTEFYNWLLQVLQSHGRPELDEIDLLIDRGFAKDARDRLDRVATSGKNRRMLDIPLAEFELKIAKATRRIGPRSRLSQSSLRMSKLLRRIGSRMTTATDLINKLWYELGFLRLIQAMFNKTRKDMWSTAVAAFRKSGKAPGRGGKIRAGLIAYSGIVHVQAVRKLCSAVFGLHDLQYPRQADINLLKRYLQKWEKNEEWKSTDYYDYCRRYINAVLTLCRSSITQGRYSEASTYFATAERIFSWKASHRTPHTLGHLQQVRAWLDPK